MITGSTIWSAISDFPIAKIALHARPRRQKVHLSINAHNIAINLITIYNTFNCIPYLPSAQLHTRVSVVIASGIINWSCRVRVSGPCNLSSSQTHALLEMQLPQIVFRYTHVHRDDEWLELIANRCLINCSAIRNNPINISCGINWFCLSLRVV